MISIETEFLNERIQKVEKMLFEHRNMDEHHFQVMIN